MMELQVQENQEWHTLNEYKTLPEALREAKNLYVKGDILRIKSTKPGVLYNAVLWTTAAIKAL